MTAVAIVGAGLAGSLLACYLGRRGWDVEVYERRGDMRAEPVPRGRSINLAVSTRGIHALREVGAADEVLAQAIPMKGRMIHAPDGSLTFQPYGTEPDQVIYSVSRQRLNVTLMNEAARFPNVTFHFHQKCLGMDLEKGVVLFEDQLTHDARQVPGKIIIGADGAHSAIRRSMERIDRFTFHQDYLDWGYKELSIPPGPGGKHLLAPNALHIWPRHDFMLIALPNHDGSFTCTLFLPFEGKDPFHDHASFLALEHETEKHVLYFFQEHFPDALPLMPTLVDDYLHNPTSSLVYVRCFPWHYRDRVALVGDACHAVVPFYGQGMNAAFEDCAYLNAAVDQVSFPLVDDNGTIAREREYPWEGIFQWYEQERKRHADALANLALQNFVEMRHKVASPLFLWKKHLEKLLHKLFPSIFVPLYTMVTFSRIPYADAVERAKKQDRWLAAAVGGVALGAIALLAAAIRALLQ